MWFLHIMLRRDLVSLSGSQLRTRSFMFFSGFSITRWSVSGALPHCIDVILHDGKYWRPRDPVVMDTSGLVSVRVYRILVRTLVGFCNMVYSEAVGTALRWSYSRNHVVLFRVGSSANRCCVFSRRRCMIIKGHVWAGLRQAAWIDISIFGEY